MGCAHGTGRGQAQSHCHQETGPALPPPSSGLRQGPGAQGRGTRKAWLCPRARALAGSMTSHNSGGGRRALPQAPAHTRPLPPQRSRRSPLDTHPNSATRASWAIRVSPPRTPQDSRSSAATRPVPRAVRGVRTTAACLWSPTGRPSPELRGESGWGQTGRAPSGRPKVENADTPGARWTVEGTVSLHVGPPQHRHAHAGSPTAPAARRTAPRRPGSTKRPVPAVSESRGGGRARTDGHRAQATRGTRDRGVCGTHTARLYLNRAQPASRECWHGRGARVQAHVEWGRPRAGDHRAG